MYPSGVFKTKDLNLSENTAPVHKTGSNLKIPLLSQIDSILYYGYLPFFPQLYEGFRDMKQIVCVFTHPLGFSCLYCFKTA